MASDQSGNKKPALPENVQIKIEPRTSLPVTLKNIKTEPGVAPTTTRLTSFRLPRDLTLGGSIKTEKTKKVYVPNLNTQRNRKKEETVVIKNDSEKPFKQRERGRGRGLSDRGRGRGNSNLIQTSGVFSQGTIDPQIGRRARGEGGGRYSSDRKPTIEKPKLNLNRVINKEEEEQKLKALLRDDFIDDGTDDAGLDTYNAPISLPVLKKGDCFKTEPKTETSTLDDEEIDQKPIILENGTVLEVKKKINKDKLIKGELIETNLWDNVSQVIENKPHSYILMQFPDCLPGLEASNDNYVPKSKHANDTLQETESKNNSQKNFTLSSLKAGMIGKLQILKSGNARLCIGKSNLIVNVGSNQSFRQDVIAAKLNTDELNGELINLGKVTNTLICSPEWNSMFLNSSSAFDNLSSV